MTALMREALSGHLLHSGSHDVNPDVCVRSCRTVTDSLPFAANSGRYAATGLSSETLPSSTSWTTAIEVKSLDIEARSKTVSVRIGSHWSRGSSVVATAPAKRGWPPGGACSCAWIWATDSAMGAGSRPSDSGLASDRTVLGGAKPRSGLLKSSAAAWPTGPPVTRLPTTARLPRAAGTSLRRRMSLLDCHWGVGVERRRQLDGPP